MNRSVVFAVAQLGPIHLDSSRKAVVERLVNLLRDAHSRGATWVTFPELALTTFFPRYVFDDATEYDRFFEESLPSPETQPLFDTARELSIGFYLSLIHI